jgi:cytidine deaminase
VGAAALVDDGRTVSAANVENASYGLSTCAELGVAVQLHATGGGRLVAIAVVGADGARLVPCGRCRQVLLEHGGPELLVDGRPLGELLPDAFGPEHLA